MALPDRPDVPVTPGRSFGLVPPSKPPPGRRARQPAATHPHETSGRQADRIHQNRHSCSARVGAQIWPPTFGIPPLPRPPRTRYPTCPSAQPNRRRCSIAREENTSLHCGFVTFRDQDSLNTQALSTAFSRSSCHRPTGQSTGIAIAPADRTWAASHGRASILLLLRRRETP